jgi:hypothetical protein
MSENGQIVQMENSDLSQAANIRFLTPKNSVFTRTPGQLLSVKIGDEAYPVVYLHCSFPHTNNRIYVSVRTIDNKEIGIIASIDEFPKETIRLMEEQIQLRYYAPSITKVARIKEEFGYSYWETETTAGACRFTVRSGGGNVKLVTDTRLLITDVDGNRFIIENLNAISQKEYRMIEMCM